MNTHDIDLPDLPEHFDVFTDRTHSEIRAYALAAIEADRKHFAELFADLNRYANGMYEQECDPYMEGVADGYGYAAEFLLGNRSAAEEIEADRQCRCEPADESQRVYLHDEGRPEYLDGARCQYVIERGKPYPHGDPVAFVYEKEDAEKIVAALNAQPAESVKGEPVGEAVIDMCEHGHKFAKLTDHPVNNQGHPSCVHCLHIGLAKARAAQPAEPVKGEPVGYFYPWELERSLKAYPNGFPGAVAVHAHPQPADPVKVPSGAEIWQFTYDFNKGSFRDSDDVIDYARALLARYGRGQK